MLLFICLPVGKYRRRGHRTACKRWFSLLVPGIKTTLSDFEANITFHWAFHLALLWRFYSKVILNINSYVLRGHMSKMNTGPKNIWNIWIFESNLLITSDTASSLAFYFILYFIVLSVVYLVVEHRVSHILDKHCAKAIQSQRIGFLKYLLLRKSFITIF